MLHSGKSTQSGAAVHIYSVHLGMCWHSSVPESIYSAYTEEKHEMLMKPNLCVLVCVLVCVCPRACTDSLQTAVQV